MTTKELSVFCTEVALLLEAAIPLDEGFYTLAQDAPDEAAKKMIHTIAEDLELGDSLSVSLERTQAFPDYVVKMIRVGEQTGNMERIMKELAAYYEKENRLVQTMRNAFTYPIAMVFVLLVVFFVLFTKVMPLFKNIYEQIGTKLSPSAETAIQAGGIISGILLVVIAATAIFAGFTIYLSGKGKGFTFTERLLQSFKERSRISAIVSKRRFAEIVSMAVGSGLGIEEGLELAKGIMPQGRATGKVSKCIEFFSKGREFHEALEESQLFEGMDLQLLKVGSRAGKLDVTMAQLAEKYEQLTDDTVDNIINKFEPTMVAILAIIVGLILLAVMMPLIGIMSSMG